VVVIPSRTDALRLFSIERNWRTRVTGTVKKIVAERGFGFITAEDGQEYFFHRSGLDSSLSFETLAADERVSFEVERSDKGPRARQVRAA
jgi:cold shock protein